MRILKLLLRSRGLSKGAHAAVCGNVNSSKSVLEQSYRGKDIMFDLNEAIYNRYIAKTKRSPTQTVGLEFELPIINLKNEPVDFSVVHDVTEKFVCQFPFTEISRDDDGFIYSAGEPGTGDNLSFDCSYNTLEFSFGKESDINLLQERFKKYYAYVRKELLKADHTITGMGINPHYDLNRNVPVLSERYRMLFHHLCSYRIYENQILFHDHPNFGLFTSASQVQLDVSAEDLPEVLNTFSLLEPLKALILANSPWGEEQEILCSRDNFWRNSLQGLNRHNVDMYGLEFESTDEIIEYIRSMSLYCVMRDGKYINFHPTPLPEYFSADSVTGEFFDGERYSSITFHPEPGDLEYLRSYKFEDLTFRGTIEFRSVCEQPVSEIFASGAMHAGLMNNIHALTELLAADHVIYHHGFNASELRRLFVRRDLPDAFDWKQVSGLITDVLDIAREGLKLRGLDEETFLDPLYARAESLMSPARELANGISSGRTMEYYIEKFGVL